MKLSVVEEINIWCTDQFVALLTNKCFMVFFVWMEGETFPQSSERKNTVKLQHHCHDNEWNGNFDF